MLQSMGSQRVGHEGATEQRQRGELGPDEESLGYDVFGLSQEMAAVKTV